MINMNKKKQIYLCEYCEHAQYDMFGEKIVDCKLNSPERFDYCDDFKRVLIEDNVQLKHAVFYI